MSTLITLRDLILQQSEQYQNQKDRTATASSATKNSNQGAKIIKQIQALSSPSSSTTISEPDLEKKTDIEILNKLATQLKPTFDYLDLLVQNFNHYIDEPRVNPQPMKELLTGATPIDQFIKEKLLEASEEINHPFIANLLKLTALDLNLFANFGKISTIFSNTGIRNKKQACQNAWKENQTSPGIQKSLLEQKRLLSSLFQRIENLNEDKIGFCETISRKDFLKNLGKLFDQIHRDNWQLPILVAERLTLNNQAIIPAENNRQNSFDKSFLAKDFPIKLDSKLLNTILRNIINNAIENSPPDSKLNLEINIIKETKENNSKPYLHIKLNNPLVNPKEFTEKNILDGTFLKTLRNLMAENGGLLKISTTKKTKSLESSDSVINIPLTAVPDLQELYKACELKFDPKNLKRITGDHSNRAINIEDLINKVKEPISSDKIESISNFLQKYINLSLEKKSSPTINSLDFNLDLKYPLEKSSEI